MSPNNYEKRLLKRKKQRNYSAALYLRLLNSHLIGFLALAKERVRLLPFGWHPGTQLLGAHLNSYYISIFYNGQRLHSYLGYMSPNNYEKQLLERKKAA
ncbi:MAG: hypothetical protein KZQ66_07660 [Candidatus Thiodiazotropha sp. (ex Lucinoma aequizonata)]|nr:hypothetical protein [Candidatus Thiodiazotropha sp. (ex Lucinoma aequizonata)]MCU7894129.1 hypothetical protein [Candidatus Thiodiazotropha sp. (ex Lucinoma aequizonata)]MCU7901877.1 hypothetical protein [Candidatus Thiodiazotropha sp. (ex Lucinoma aequizonata)]MCU7908598.1 hypothetical protein [Candidatus Thiodiazotropha sp. (ex Lucinoma aequizonata)]MCU7914200.1 hypothetical protein [Candidatus Thiodiazotropha sp. (ex Lucinoma aequizonata)]